MAVIVKNNFIYIKQPHAYLRYASNMFTTYEKNPSKTSGVADYTPIVRNSRQND